MRKHNHFTKILEDKPNQHFANILVKFCRAHEKKVGWQKKISLMSSIVSKYDNSHREETGPYFVTYEGPLSLKSLGHI
jgi:hypothetical protein